jgi:hypothetical protein
MDHVPSDVLLPQTNVAREILTVNVLISLRCWIRTQPDQ